MMSDTREDYLRAILLLESRIGTVRNANLAEYLDLAKNTVSERLRDLSKAGLVLIEPYKPIKLSSQGRDIAENLTYKHRIIEVFLHKLLGLPKDRLHKEAHKLEHAFSDDVIARLEKKLRYPKRDPHGSRIR